MQNFFLGIELISFNEILKVHNTKHFNLEVDDGIGNNIVINILLNLNLE